MPAHEEFRRFGLWTVENFLDHDSVRLRAEARSAQAHQARITISVVGPSDQSF